MSRFQGGNFYEVLSLSGSNPLSAWSAKGQKSIEYNSDVKSHILKMDGAVSSTYITPKDDKIPLGLEQGILTLQVLIPEDCAFSVTLNITDSTKSRRRVILSTSNKEAKMDTLHTRLPLHDLPRDQWLNLCFNLVSIADFSFHTQFKYLDTLTISGCCRLKRIFTLKALPPPPFDNSDFPEKMAYAGDVAAQGFLVDAGSFAAAPLNMQVTSKAIRASASLSRKDAAILVSAAAAGVTAAPSASPSALTHATAPSSSTLGLEGLSISSSGAPPPLSASGLSPTKPPSAPRSPRILSADAANRRVRSAGRAPLTPKEREAHASTAATSTSGHLAISGSTSGSPATSRASSAASSSSSVLAAQQQHLQQPPRMVAAEAMSPGTRHRKSMSMSAIDPATLVPSSQQGELASSLPTPAPAPAMVEEVPAMFVYSSMPRTPPLRHSRAASANGVSQSPPRTAKPSAAQEMASDFLGGSWEARSFESYRQHHQSRPVSRPSGEADSRAHQGMDDPRATLSPPVSRASARMHGLLFGQQQDMRERRETLQAVAGDVLLAPDDNMVKSASALSSEDDGVGGDATPVLPAIHVPEDVTAAAPAPLVLAGFAVADDDFLSNESWRNAVSSADEEERDERADSSDQPQRSLLLSRGSPQMSKSRPKLSAFSVNGISSSNATLHASIDQSISLGSSGDLDDMRLTDRFLRDAPVALKASPGGGMAARVVCEQQDSENEEERAAVAAAATRMQQRAASGGSFSPPVRTPSASAYGHSHSLGGSTSTDLGDDAVGSLASSSASVFANGTDHTNGYHARTSSFNSRRTASGSQLRPVHEERELSPAPLSTRGGTAIARDNAKDEEEEEEEELALVYDPVLNCYFDPTTNKYYELA